MNRRRSALVSVLAFAMVACGITSSSSNPFLTFSANVLIPPATAPAQATTARPDSIVTLGGVTDPTGCAAISSKVVANGTQLTVRIIGTSSPGPSCAVPSQAYSYRAAVFPVSSGSHRFTVQVESGTLPVVVLTDTTVTVP
jgi:hypothetical protein